MFVEISFSVSEKELSVSEKELSVSEKELSVSEKELMVYLYKFQIFTLLEPSLVLGQKHVQNPFVS